MRSLLIVAALATVAACAEPAEQEPEVVEEIVEAGPLAADGQPTPGTYRVTGPDGTVETEVLSADGTYTSTNADGEVTSTGNWEQRDQNTYCYNDAENAEMVCNLSLIHI